MPLPPNWQRRLLRQLGAPATPANLQFLNEWHLREGGGDKNTAHYNPLNTTQRAPGATAMNSVGVKAYRNAQQGITATVQTLTNGRYDDIVSGLRSGRATVAQLASSASLRVWGTGTWASSGKAGAGAGGATAAPLSLPEGGVSAPVQPQYTVQDAMREGLQALASGTYDPTKGLAALRRASEATAAAAKASAGTQEINYGSMALPVMGAPGSKFGQRAVRTIQQYLGIPYVWGGESPKGFDCSGLLQYVWNQLGVKIPRVTYDQWKAGRSVGRGQLRPGDAVFFRPGPRGPEHVGMFIGGGQFVEAARTGTPVRISTLKGRGDYMGARRYA